MTLPKGPARVQAKAELVAYNQIKADKEEALIRKSKAMLAEAEAATLPTMGLPSMGNAINLVKNTVNLKSYF